MHYFTIDTIKESIERLQQISANWLLPAFVFAANDVGTDGLVDMSKGLGTDQFLDRYFNGKRLGIPPFSTGKNLLRPRLKGISWESGKSDDDYVVRQNTKMWGNLFSSRGYREMRLEGLIEGEKAINRLTDAFQPRFEAEIPEQFQFEDFLVWLFAFEGIPDEVNSWTGLYTHLLHAELGLEMFKAPYLGRFKVSQPLIPWPVTVADRLSNDDFLRSLAPNLLAILTTSVDDILDVNAAVKLPVISDDDPVFATIAAAVQAEESLSFLLAGPPGTGKTRYARMIAERLTEGIESRMLFLQFHPAIGYDDFVEGFRPVKDEAGLGVRYKLEPRIFLEFARKAAAHPDDMYVAVIDELNRGDVARVFGEMLTYMEVDYRGKEFSLSYSGDKAFIPRNLVILATANPFDRSVTDLDDALLRRFWVIELEPDGTFLRNFLETALVDGGVVNRTVQLFEILNSTLPSGFGHTTFLKVTSVDELAAIWTGRIRLALRRAFVHDRATFDSVEADVERLLSARADAEAVDPINAQ
jgi:MoxR-like ATPase